MLGRGFEKLGEFKVIGFFICNASLNDPQTSRSASINCTRYGTNSHKRWGPPGHVLTYWRAKGCNKVFDV